MGTSNGKSLSSSRSISVITGPPAVILAAQVTSASITFVQQTQKHEPAFVINVRAASAWPSGSHDAQMHHGGGGPGGGGGTAATASSSSSTAFSSTGAPVSGTSSTNAIAAAAAALVAAASSSSSSISSTSPPPHSAATSAAPSNSTSSNSFGSSVSSPPLSSPTELSFDIHRRYEAFDRFYHALRALQPHHQQHVSHVPIHSDPNGPTFLSDMSQQLTAWMNNLLANTTLAKQTVTMLFFTQQDFLTASLLNNPQQQQQMQGGAGGGGGEENKRGLPPGVRRMRDDDECMLEDDEDGGGRGREEEDEVDDGGHLHGAADDSSAMLEDIDHEEDADTIADISVAQVGVEVASPTLPPHDGRVHTHSTSSPQRAYRDHHSRPPQSPHSEEMRKSGGSGRFSLPPAHAWQHSQSAAASFPSTPPPLHLNHPAQHSPLTLSPRQLPPQSHTSQSWLPLPPTTVRAVGAAPSSPAHWSAAAAASPVQGSGGDETTNPSASPSPTSASDPALALQHHSHQHHHAHAHHQPHPRDPSLHHPHPHHPHAHHHHQQSHHPHHHTSFLSPEPGSSPLPSSSSSSSTWSDSLSPSHSQSAAHALTHPGRPCDPSICPPSHASPGPASPQDPSQPSSGTLNSPQHAARLVSSPPLGGGAGVGVVHVAPSRSSFSFSPSLSHSRRSLSYNTGGRHSSISLSQSTRSSTSAASKPAVRLRDFLLLKVIGKGSFGKVLLVRKKDSGKVYAMKVLAKESVIKRNQVEHTLTERSVLEYIRHPYIVALRYAFQTRHKLYFILDYCPGGELFFHLGKAGRFSESRAKFYAAQIILALEHLHSHSVIYRDLKPENVLLDEHGNAMLTDFGLSKEGINDNISAHSFCGTPEYLAPEILTRTGHGRAADWWSLGAILFEMVVGMPPFYSRQRERLFQKILSSSLRLPRSLSSECRHLLLSLLDRNPLTRIGSRHDAMELKMHPFFADIDWEALAEKRLPPPFKPHIAQQTDTDNFDVEFTSMPLHSHEDKHSSAATAAITAAIAQPAAAGTVGSQLTATSPASGDVARGGDVAMATTSSGVLSALNLSGGGAEGEESDEEEACDELDRGQFANFTFVAEELLHTRDTQSHLMAQDLDLYQQSSSSTPQPPSSYAQHPPYEPAPLYPHMQSPPFHSNHWQLHSNDPHPA